MSQLDGRRNVFSQAKTKMHRIVDDIISSRKTGTTTHSDFLSSLLGDSQINDMSSIRDTLLVLLLAGRESTQNTISWMMYAITQNPKWATLLKEEAESQARGPDIYIPSYSELQASAT